VVHTNVADRRIAFRPLFRDELVMLVSKRHPFAVRKWVDVSDFSGQHVLHAVPAELNVFLQQALRKARVSPRRVSHLQLTEALIEMVKADLGVAVLAHRRRLLMSWTGNSKACGSVDEGSGGNGAPRSFGIAPGNRFCARSWMILARRRT
jgi:DNA-binding transcriptional LysR family regulator